MSELRPTSTACFRALGHRFSVHTFAELADHLDTMFSALGVDARPNHRYELSRSGGADRGWTLTMDDVELVRSKSASTVFAHLCWHVNRTAIDGCTDRILLHSSGAVDAVGRAVLLPADSGSGKTTLVAGLAQSGLAYLSDEAVGIELVSGTLLGYPKPLSIDPGSWSVLEAIRPQPHPAVAPFVETQWHVPPDALGAVARSARAAVVVSPSYVAGGGTNLRPLSPAETLVVLAENAFNLRGFGHAGFETLATVATECSGYSLEHDDLEDAVATITALLEGAMPE